MIAVYLLDFHAFFLLFDLLRLGIFPTPLCGPRQSGAAVAGYGTANERRWA